MTTKTETGEVVQAPQKLTVGFERSVSVRPYETAKASIFVGQDISGTYDEKGLFVPNDGAVAEAATLAFFEAKCAVLKQLGLPFDVVENVVIETIDKHLGPAEVVSGNAPAPARKTAPSGNKRSKEELQADLVANPNDWWDNRDSKTNPKAPDYKHKKSGEGIWLK